MLDPWQKADKRHRFVAAAGTATPGCRDSIMAELCDATRESAGGTLPH
jgi:hypothetical protein